jgi:cytosine deaminase
MDRILEALKTASAYRLANAAAPCCLVDDTTGLAGLADDLVALDIDVAGGRIAAIGPAGGTPSDDLAVIDLKGRQVWPCFVDLHTHLDKGHIWQRSPNPDGSFAGALETAAADHVHWGEDDTRRRFAFGLATSHAHGTSAIRTHIDSSGPQAETSWRVFAELRDAWRDRIELQAVSILLSDYFDEPYGDWIADLVAECGGILGAVTFMSPNLDRQLDRMFTAAGDRGLDLDFHVDESGDADARSLKHIAMAARRTGFDGRIVAGHCCSLAVQPADAVRETLDLVAEAGISVVSLPMCNLFLQDRMPGHTPRWRGVTLLHEFRARGIPVSVASDNCRDPFYGFGDHDMLEVFTQAVRIAHLDRPYGDWPAAVTRTPAAEMGLADAGRLAAGGPADIIVFRGRYYSELLSRQQSDRIVLRAGRQIDTTLPAYEELDDLMEKVRQ